MTVITIYSIVLLLFYPRSSTPSLSYPRQDLTTGSLAPLLICLELPTHLSYYLLLVCSSYSILVLLFPPMFTLISPLVPTLLSHYVFTLLSYFVPALLISINILASKFTFSISFSCFKTLTAL